jgi:DNA-binding CsgD family transcriptional regulator
VLRINPRSAPQLPAGGPPACVLEALAERLGPQALAALDRNGRLLWASPRAQALLQGALPDSLAEAARRLGGAGRTFTLHLHERALEVELSPAAGGEVVLLALERSGAPGAALVETARRFQLTPAESDVVALAARGLRNRQIAAFLQVGLPTVKTHLAHAFSKMGVQTRTQAALAVRRLG